MESRYTHTHTQRDTLHIFSAKSFNIFLLSSCPFTVPSLPPLLSLPSALMLTVALAGKQHTVCVCLLCVLSARFTHQLIRSISPTKSNSDHIVNKCSVCVIAALVVQSDFLSPSSLPLQTNIPYPNDVLTLTIFNALSH